jgi:hypothetical protein
MQGALTSLRNKHVAGNTDDVAQIEQFFENSVVKRFILQPLSEVL